MSKILHIFSDSPYAEKFIRFINSNFDLAEHLFIILCTNQNSKFLPFYRTQTNCKITQNKSIYFEYMKEFKTAEQIIIHQLNKPILMICLLFFYSKAYKKVVWSVWGGDVYYYKTKSNTLKNILIELIRKITIYKIPIITSYIKGDYEEVVKIYKTSATYIRTKYPSPVDEGKILKFSKINKKIGNNINILVGNSADPLNNHIEVFNLLKKYKNENINVIVVLSYGGLEDYIEQVIIAGESIFGKKFVPILDYMNFDNYISFLSTIDVCIFNHNQQQGLGNIYILLALYKKVYMNTLVSSYKYYNGLGVCIHDTKEILKLSFEEFKYQSYEEMTSNYNLILKDINEETIRKEWENIFNKN